MRGDFAFRRGDLTLRRGILATLFCLLAAMANGLPEDADQPIHLRADNAEGDMTGFTILTG